MMTNPNFCKISLAKCVLRALCTKYPMITCRPSWNTPSPVPRSTGYRSYYTGPHQPLWNTPPRSYAGNTFCTEAKVGGATQSQ